MAARASLAGSVLLIAVQLALAGCGQKAPLYLPAKPKAKVPATTSAPPSASPSTAAPTPAPAGR